MAVWVWWRQRSLINAKDPTRAMELNGIRMVKVAPGLRVSKAMEKTLQVIKAYTS